MRREINIRRDPLPPLPDFNMKEGEKRMFLAEESFLLSLPWKLFPEVLNQERRKELFSQQVADLSSTEMAEQLFLAYGFKDGICHSSRDLGRKYNASGHVIDTNTRVVVQSLWLLYANYFSEDLYGFKKTLASRYLVEGELPRDFPQGRVLERAKRNIDYYRDREFILKHEEETLKLLGGMYGRETPDVFSRFYRLGEYKDLPNFERRGNFSFANGNSEERLKLEDALEVGHAAVEYFAGLAYGTIAWTGIRGQKVAGYRRKGAYFESILKRYQEQEKIAQDLKNPDLRVSLGALQVELLELTTSAKLEGRDKKDGLEEFNRRHHTKYRLMDVKALERKVLVGFRGDRLTDLDRKEKIRKLLKDDELTCKLGSILRDILFEYHIEGHTLQQIADNLGCNQYSLGELKRFLERLILNHTVNANRVPVRGEVTKKMIDRFFRDERLDPDFVRLIRRIANSKDIHKLARSVYPDWPGTEHGFELLRRLAVRVVDESSKLRVEN